MYVHAPRVFLLLNTCFRKTHHNFCSGVPSLWQAEFFSMSTPRIRKENLPKWGTLSKAAFWKSFGIICGFWNIDGYLESQNQRHRDRRPSTTACPGCLSFNSQQGSPIAGQNKLPDECCRMDFHNFSSFSRKHAETLYISYSLHKDSFEFKDLYNNSELVTQSLSDWKSFVLFLHNQLQIYLEQHQIYRYFRGKGNWFRHQKQKSWGHLRINWTVEILNFIENGENTIQYTVNFKKRVEKEEEEQTENIEI